MARNITVPDPSPSASDQNPTTHSFLPEESSRGAGDVPMAAAVTNTANAGTDRANAGADDGAPADYVTLVSNDGFEFVVLRGAAEVSGLCRRMLDSRNNFIEAREGRCVFDNINGVILEKVCEYLYYNEKYKGVKDVPDMDLPPELCLELLMAADYLDT